MCQITTSPGGPARGKARELAAGYGARDVYASAATHMRVIEDRDRAQSWNSYLWAACATLFLALIFVGANPPKPAPKPAACPSPGVMQLDPTTVRAREYEAQWL